MPTGEPRLPQLADHYILQTILSYDDSAHNAEIKRLLAQLETELYPFIVAGDFNMSEHAVMYNEVAESMDDAFRKAGTGWGGSWPISVVEDLPASVPPLLRVDYIWHSAHFRGVKACRGPELGSDHMPFYAMLEF